LTGIYGIISYSCCSIGRRGVMTWKSLSLRYWGNLPHDSRASVKCFLLCALLPIEMDDSLAITVRVVLIRDNRYVFLWILQVK
jgi:hypothetical protein